MKYTPQILRLPDDKLYYINILSHDGDVWTTMDICSLLDLKKDDYTKSVKEYGGQGTELIFESVGIPFFTFTEMKQAKQFRDNYIIPRLIMVKLTD